MCQTRQAQVQWKYASVLILLYSPLSLSFNHHDYMLCNCNGTSASIFQRSDFYAQWNVRFGGIAWRRRRKAASASSIQDNLARKGVVRQRRSQRLGAQSRAQVRRRSIFFGKIPHLLGRSSLYTCRRDFSEPRGTPVARRNTRKLPSLPTMEWYARPSDRLSLYLHHF